MLWDCCGPMSSAELHHLPDLARIRREHRRGNLDRVVLIDGVSRWAQLEEFTDIEEDRRLSGTVVEYEVDAKVFNFTVHYDASILPGQTVVYNDHEVEINSVEQVGRARYMRLFCSVRTPAQVIE